MSKTSSKIRRVLQNKQKGKLAKKSPKKAENTRARTLPAAAKRTKKRRSKKMPTCLTVAERVRFFKAITSTRDRGIFSLAYFHGMRVSELALLKFSDYRGWVQLKSRPG